MALLKNSGTEPARVFGPCGAIIRVEPGETVEVTYTLGELRVEDGGHVELSDKPAPAKKEPAKDTKKEGE